jgi:hypothetical protein
MDITVTRMFLEVTECVGMIGPASHGLTLNHPQLLSVGIDINNASSGRGSRGNEK